MSGTPDPFESRQSRAARFLCRTSKMSHDHSRHDSCSLPLLNRWIHSIILSLARGMTAVVVGSGALLGHSSLQIRNLIQLYKHLKQWAIRVGYCFDLSHWDE